MDEEIKAMMGLWEKYPSSNQVYANFVSEYWSFKSDSIEEAKRAFEYLKLWKENILNKANDLYDFVDDQLVYKPVFGDPSGLISQPATLGLKMCLKLKN